MADQLVSHAKQAIDNAYKNKSKLNNIILAIHGMSGDKTRHLYNNMCSLDDCRYLEIGAYKGSSFISAMYGNSSCEGYCVDHWKEFGGKHEFYENVQAHIPNAKMHLLDKNCWEVTNEDIPSRINVFMYDGAHTYMDQKRAITYFAPFLSKFSIIMIDDWNCDWVDVRRGTMDGIVDAKLKIHFKEEIGLVNTKSYHTGGDTFWNGCGIFVCERTDI